jgi:hypothetical protein
VDCKHNLRFTNSVARTHGETNITRKLVRLTRSNVDIHNLFTGVTSGGGLGRVQTVTRVIHIILEVVGYLESGQMYTMMLSTRSTLAASMMGSKATTLRLTSVGKVKALHA